MRVKPIAAGIAFACSLLSAIGARAQDDAALLRDGLFLRDNNVAVEERPKPEYDPLPVRAGAFIVVPAVTTRLEWDGNVFATGVDKVSDEIVHLEPSISLTSDWSHNAVSAFARLDSSLYVAQTGEDTVDYAVGAAGRMDVRRDLGLAGGASFERDTEPRTDEASPPSATHPIQYDLESAWIEGTKDLDRLRLTARASIDDYTYENASTFAGAEIYEKDQDHTTSVGAFKAEYAYLPDVSFLTRLTVNYRDYRDQLLGEIARTSSGYEAGAGIDFDLTHLMRGEVLAGYLEQDYGVHSSFKTTRGLALRGSASYFATPLMTITLSGSREVKDSGIVDVDGFLASAVSLKLDHELLRNLVLTSTLTYTDDRYQGYRRDDKITEAGFAASYLINRAASLKLTLSDLKQDSTGANAGRHYDVACAAISLTYRV